MQVAVNYASNGATVAIISALRLFLKRFEEDGAATQAATNTEEAFKLIQDQQLPAAFWPYVQHGLELCSHMLSHWGATRLSTEKKGDVLDPTAAPLLLAQQGLVDVLLEIINMESGAKSEDSPPKALLEIATDILKTLFEQNGHINLFCMQHYAEVRAVIKLGCDSLIGDPLPEYPDLQQQAVETLVAASKRFFKDDKLCKRILRAMSAIFETSPGLMLTFLTEYRISTPGASKDSDKALPTPEAHLEAVRAVGHVAFWGPDDAPLMPDFVSVLAELLSQVLPPPADAGPGATGGLEDLSEAEALAGACVASLLRLLMVDPNPPDVQQCLIEQLGKAERNTGDTDSERAVKLTMRIMETFPSSDRMQMNCQHLLTTVLGE